MSHYVSLLAWNSICRPGWLWTLSASVSHEQGERHSLPCPADFIPSKAKSYPTAWRGQVSLICHKRIFTWLPLCLMWLMKLRTWLYISEPMLFGPLGCTWKTIWRFCVEPFWGTSILLQSGCDILPKIPKISLLTFGKIISNGHNSFRSIEKNTPASSTQFPRLVMFSIFSLRWTENLIGPLYSNFRL